jgi:hypothetical protein
VGEHGRLVTPDDDDAVRQAHAVGKEQGSCQGAGPRQGNRRAGLRSGGARRAPGGGEIVAMAPAAWPIADRPNPPGGSSDSRHSLRAARAAPPPTRLR